jgi:hypothetical protein
MNPNPLEPEAASGDTSACLRWLHVNLVLSRSVSLSEEQLRQLSHAVGDDAVRLPIALEPPRPLTRSVVRPALMTDAGAHGDGRGCDDGPRRRRDVVRGPHRGSTVGRRQGHGVRRLLHRGVVHAVTHM